MVPRLHPSRDEEAGPEQASARCKRDTPGEAKKLGKWDAGCADDSRRYKRDLTAQEHSRGIHPLIQIRRWGCEDDELGIEALDCAEERKGGQRWMLCFLDDGAGRTEFCSLSRELLRSFDLEPRSV